MATFNVLHKAGPLRNGAQRGAGTVWHAVVGDYAAGGPALCGTQPRIMWSKWSPEGTRVTCPKCLKAIADDNTAKDALTAENNAIHDALYGFDDHGWR